MLTLYQGIQATRNRLCRSRARLVAFFVTARFSVRDRGGGSMVRIAVIDGQGGGIGRLLVEKLVQAFYE